VAPGSTLGIVGESGCGKSVTARSILRIVDRPGRIVGGEIRFRRPAPNGRAGASKRSTWRSSSRTVRDAVIRAGGDRADLSGADVLVQSVHTVGNQITEAILLHQPVGRRAARDRAIETLRRVGVSSPEERMNQLSNQLSGGCASGR